VRDTAPLSRQSLKLIRLDARLIAGLDNTVANYSVKFNRPPAVLTTPNHCATSCPHGIPLLIHVCRCSVGQMLYFYKYHFRL